MRGTLAVFALAAHLAACGTPPSKPVPTVAEAITVQTRVLAPQPVPDRFESGGTVRPAVTAEIVSRVMAPVVDLPVAAGARVAAGASLVVLDARQAQADRERAAAGARAAEQAEQAATAQVARAVALRSIAAKTHERISTLRAKNSSTEQELDRAQADLDAAVAEEQGARSALLQASANVTAARAAESAAAVVSTYSVLRAPFAGLVTETRIERGSMAAPGVPLVVLEDPRQYRLEVQVDEARLDAVRMGQAAQVRLGEQSGAARSLTGVVSEVERVVNAAHTFTVKVRLPVDAGLRSGVFGVAVFEGAARDRLLAPASSVIRRGQLSFVYVVESGRAHLRAVQVGRAFEDGLEVLAGLASGDTVVLQPPARLQDGAPVAQGGPAVVQNEASRP